MIRKAKRKFKKKQAEGKMRPFFVCVELLTKSEPTIGLLKDAGDNTVSEADLLRVTFKDVLPEKTQTELLSQMLKDIGESYNLWISALSR
jgi:hypothetical protein